MYSIKLGYLPGVGLKTCQTFIVGPSFFTQHSKLRILGGMKTYTTVDAYIKAQPKTVQDLLREMRALVTTAAPHATETISYGMPTYVGKKNLVHFAAMKNHLGLYPTPSAVTKFSSELRKYSTSKGCIRLLYTAPLPKTLITKIVKFRVVEDKKEK